MSQIRLRCDEDIDDLEALIHLTRAVDGYPMFLVDDDARTFLLEADVLGAWASGPPGAIEGHVALHRDGSDPVMDLACRSLSVSREQLGLVARLFVAPRARGQGLGQRLLTFSAEQARELALTPILDVSVRYEGAIDLYVKAGWTCLGQVTFSVPEAPPFEELVFVAPEVIH